MGLFTGPALSSRRPIASAPLKRRSLGRSPDKARNEETSAKGLQAEDGDSEVIFKGRAFVTESVRQDDPPGPEGRQGQSVAPLTAQALPSGPTLIEATVSDEEQELDLADLQSDNAYMYERSLPSESALGMSPSRLPEPDMLVRIEAYVADHYLDCFGITHHDELIRHHDRIVPFFAKAPRFLSIHSLKRKELERDYAEVVDTTETCPREELCLGRCLLGFSCPTGDLLVE